MSRPAGTDDRLVPPDGAPADRYGTRVIAPFSMQLPVRVRFGNDAVDSLPSLVEGRRVLVVAESTVLAIPAVAHPLMRAQDALVDPLLTLGLPPEATAQTGVDALAQAIGGVIVSNGNPASIALGLEACRHVAAGLEPVVRDGSDRDARERMS